MTALPGARSADLLAAGPQPGVQHLQRGNSDVGPVERLDALDRRGRPGDRGDAGDVGGHRGGADLVPVDAWPALPVGRVDDQVDLAGPDQLDDGALAGAPALEVLGHDV